MVTVDKKKYVVLEHLNLPNRGFRFWTTNTENNTHSMKGELWYKEILFTDSTEEAIKVSRGNNGNTPKYHELEAYWIEEHRKEKERDLKKDNELSNFKDAISNNKAFDINDGF